MVKGGCDRRWSDWFLLRNSSSLALAFIHGCLEVQSYGNVVGCEWDRYEDLVIEVGATKFCCTESAMRVQLVIEGHEGSDWRGL